MNISVFSSGKNVFVNFECIKGYAFKNAVIWAESVLLAVSFHILSDILLLPRDVYALLYERNPDYFKCLSPHKIYA